MRIVERSLITSTDDVSLSQLGNGEPIVVINPELDMSVLDYIQLDIVPQTSYIKYKVGQGWIAKVFPAEWNGGVKIIQVKPNAIIKSNAYVDNVPAYTPDAWDLKYKHVWVYEGTTIEAVTIDYLPTTEGVKTIGTVKFIPSVNQFDVIFISYNEPSAENNWQRLLTKCPTAKRVNGIKGILNAHKAAAELSTTDMFWVVDADAYIVDNFEFNSFIYDRNTTYIWHSRNPVNGLEYGYGGVKLFPRAKLLNNTDMLVDVSTSLGSLQVIKQVACETRFNTDPFNTWKSAFRECAKLAAGVIKNQISKDTQHRLDVWCTIGDEYSTTGANAGRLYGKQNKDKLININNYEWLYEQFLNR